MHRCLWILIATAALASAVLPPAAAQPPSKRYVLLYKEDFNGNALNENDWFHRTGRRRAGTFDCLNLKDAVSVSGGYLHIKVEQRTIDGKLENVGGGVISTHRFGYGYYETRSRPYMAGSGVHSAFWQRGVDGDGYPNGAVLIREGRLPVLNTLFEIDSYEIDSPRWSGTNNLYAYPIARPFSEVPWPLHSFARIMPLPGGWIVDAYEYTPHGVIFYDNGKEVARASYDNSFGAQNVWLTALNGFGKVDGSKLPGETLFDYFRFYARDYPGANLLPNGNFEYNQDAHDPQNPMAWAESGDRDSSFVERGNAARDHYKLRHYNPSADYRVTTSQRLEYINNGEYVLTAMVRSSGGQKTARLRALDYGGPERFVEIPASDKWKKISIPGIQVSRNAVTIAITSKAFAGQWLEIDDVEFMKPPLAGRPARPKKPFVAVPDPIWMDRETVTFTGAKGILLDRLVGNSRAMTIAMWLEPERRADMLAAVKMPKTGKNGWAVRLAANGDIEFQVGSQTDHMELVAPAAYQAQTPVHIACEFQDGAALLYVNGKLVKSEPNLTYSPASDTVGHIGMQTAYPDRLYVGKMRDMRVYNRTLGCRELARLAAGRD